MIEINNFFKITSIIEQVKFIAPLILLLSSSVIVLLLDVFSSSKNKRYIAYLSSFMLSGILLYLTYLFSVMDFSVSVFHDSIIVDRFSIMFSIVFVIIAIIISLASIDYLEKNNIFIGEFHALVILSILGMSLIVQSRSLILIFVSLELLSIPIYVLSGLFRAYKRSLESSIKYYIMGSVASTIMLFGVSLLYGVTASVDIIEIGKYISNYNSFSNIITNDPIIIIAMFMILVGLLFKLAIAPFHMWTPDVYEGAPTIVTGFMSVAVKASMFALTLKIFYYTFNQNSLLINNVGNYLKSSWLNIFVILACVSIVYANLVAVVQKDIKRMLSYSAIVHAGYLMIGLASFFISTNVNSFSAFVFYIVSYVFSGLGAFIVLGILESDESSNLSFDDLNSIAYKNPFLAFSITIFMLSFASIPIFAGFIGKFYMFKHAYLDANLHIPIIIALITSIISIFYYLKITIHMYMKKSSDEIKKYSFSFASTLAIIISLIVTLYLGLIPDRVIDIIEKGFTFLGV